MRQATVDLFEFDELTDEAKATVIDYHRGQLRVALEDRLDESVRYEMGIAGMQLLNEDDERDVKRYLSDPYHVKNLVRTTHDYIDVESIVEREFAMRLDGDDNVKVFMKMPRWFKIDTPLGSDNPDWAIVYGQDERVYMVRETKDKPNKDDLRDQERRKVDCGEKHFATIGVDFMMVTNLTDALRPVQGVG